MTDETSSGRASISSKDPIFIMGILQRSGTNFLDNLLLLHQDCCAPAPIWEDYLVHYANLLVPYKNTVFKRWTGITPGVDARFGDLLFESLGNGMLSLLASLVGDKRVVTKTPSAHNLDYFFKLFPRARLLIVIRDGRSLVESMVVSFGGYYDIAMRKWAEAARTILHFDQANRQSSLKYLIVRYENLVNNLERELRRILAFLDLNPETYDFNGAANLPVRGSSDLRRSGEYVMHWEPIQKTANFKPVERWSRWNRARHERFNWIAGQYQQQFGYDVKQHKENRLLWFLWNKLMDIRLAILWHLRQLKRTSHIWKYDPW